MATIGPSAVLREDRLRSASDGDLVGAVRNGELEALGEVFRRHAAAVAGTVRRTVGAYYVDDVVQEVFLSLWRSPERFRPERGSLAGYLVCLTHGRAIDALRSDTAWQRRNVDHGAPPAQAADVEAEVLGRLSEAHMQKALRALPAAERVAIELAFFGGNSYREVAMRLGQPEGTVKSRIRSGLRRLESTLELAALVP